MKNISDREKNLELSALFCNNNVNEGLLKCNGRAAATDILESSRFEDIHFKK